LSAEACHIIHGDEVHEKRKSSPSLLISFGAMAK